MSLAASVTFALLLSVAAPHADRLPEPAVLDAVVVTGEQPGPGLWKVSKDDHVLWILGGLSPLPKKMRWVSREVEATIAASQEVVLAPSAELSIDGGMLRGLFLLPAAMGARNNPDGALLAEVVPADLYARWTSLKHKYIGRSRGVEKRRPIFAAYRLYEKAIARSGLSLANNITPVVTRAAKRHRVPVTRPSIEIKLAEPGAVLREFAHSPLDDVDCFRRTLERLENDLETMAARGNAWATGDIEALQALPYTDQTRACADAFLQAGVMQGRGMENLEQRLEDAWLAAVEGALARNRVSFAMLPMALVLDVDGYVAALRSRGYAVEEPWIREARELEAGQEPTTAGQ